MAPILKDMEHLSETIGLDIEVPSYVDDIILCVLNHVGVENVMGAPIQYPQVLQ